MACLFLHGPFFATARGEQIARLAAQHFFETSGSSAEAYAKVGKQVRGKSKFEFSVEPQAGVWNTGIVDGDGWRTGVRGKTHKKCRRRTNGCVVEGASLRRLRRRVQHRKRATLRLPHGRRRTSARTGRRKRKRPHCRVHPGAKRPRTRPQFVARAKVPVPVPAEVSWCTCFAGLYSCGLQVPGLSSGIWRGGRGVLGFGCAKKTRQG